MYPDDHSPQPQPPRCSACGAALVPGARFCFRCGVTTARLTPEACPDRPTGEPVCDKCGEPLDAGHSFCSQCGQFPTPSTLPDTFTLVTGRGGVPYPRADVSPSDSSLSDRPTKAWYLLPWFLGLIGGLVRWLVVRDRLNHSCGSRPIRSKMAGRGNPGVGYEERFVDSTETSARQPGRD